MCQGVFGLSGGFSTSPTGVFDYMELLIRAVHLVPPSAWRPPRAAGVQGLVSELQPLIIQLTNGLDLRAGSWTETLHCGSA